MLWCRIEMQDYARWLASLQDVQCSLLLPIRGLGAPGEGSVRRINEILAAVADAIAGVGFSVPEWFAQVVSAAGSIAWTVPVIFFGASPSRSPSSISESFQVASTGFRGSSSRRLQQRSVHPSAWNEPSPKFALTEF
jgi:hypothetical protein